MAIQGQILGSKGVQYQLQWRAVGGAGVNDSPVGIGMGACTKHKWAHSHPILVGVALFVIITIHYHHHQHHHHHSWQDQHIQNGIIM